ncbi:phage tail protein [Pseudomonas sp. NFACC08-1]|uniref:phage tail protein n=1 Tax=Pseudomonas sp. NFACC08-1 TaxID=1566238 RepID=UPI00089626FF|nr:phage tail protein [Pseudomonas sp. NFACC08-1]SDX40101.1 Phage tail-collar fibre protein [Pseudomonas sp. NFACC08-1]
MADYYTLLTDAGIAYETACKAAGTPIKLSQISVGDGGGEVYNPAATATALKREVWRGPLNALFQDEKNPSWLLAEVTIPPEVGGWYVREAGIWTDTGILYAIVKYPESFKPVLATSGSGKEFYIRSIFETSNAELVTLLIDDTVVKATRAWVASYVADELAKLDRKQSVRVATTANIVLSGAQAIDGVAVVAGNRVLVKSQTLAKDNGIYVVANGAWIRAKDADASAEVTSGLIVSVEEGATLANTIWQLVTDGAIVLGTTGLVFQNITQGFAPLNSPALLGVPTAPTAPVSTNNQQLATTAFVQRALGNHSSVGGLDASTVLTADAFGRSFIINSANPVNITLPKASTGFNGGTINLLNVSTGTVTVILQGTDYVAGIAANQLVLKTMDSITLSTGAGITWYAENGSVSDALSTAFNGGVRAIMARYGLGAAAYNYTGNIDSLVENGVFLVSASTTGTKPEYPPQQGTGQIPQGTVFHMERGSSNMATQVWDSLVNSILPITCIRTRTANGVWTPWAQIWSSNNTPKQANPLDLTAGAMLVPGSFGIGKAVVSTETNLNNYTVSGIYLVPESGLVNIPSGWSTTRRYNLTVGLAGVGSRLTQTLISGMSGDAVGMAIRVCQENGAWTDWEEVTTSRHGPFKATQTYKAAGVFTWAVPAGVKKVWVTVFGGGGGGGRFSHGGGGGGGGGIAEGLVDLTGVSSVTVTVGAGGAGWAGSDGDGAPGSASSFGSFMSATGGAGASKWYGGLAGIGSGGDINTTLGSGGHATRHDNGVAPSTSIYGGGHGAGGRGYGAGAGSIGQAGTSSTLVGGGGGGGNENGNGGNGSPGQVVIRW